MQTIKPEPDANPDASLDTWLVALEAVLQQAAVDADKQRNLQRRISDAFPTLRESDSDSEGELEQGPRREPQSEDAISTEHVQEP